MWSVSASQYENVLWVVRRAERRADRPCPRCRRCSAALWCLSCSCCCTAFETLPLWRGLSSSAAPAAPDEAERERRKMRLSYMKFKKNTHKHSSSACVWVCFCLDILMCTVCACMHAIISYSIFKALRNHFKTQAANILKPMHRKFSKWAKLLIWHQLWHLSKGNLLWLVWEVSNRLGISCGGALQTAESCFLFLVAFCGPLTASSSPRSTWCLLGAEMFYPFNILYS